MEWREVERWVRKKKGFECRATVLYLFGVAAERERTEGGGGDCVWVEIYY